MTVPVCVIRTNFARTIGNVAAMTPPVPVPVVAVVHFAPSIETSILNSRGKPITGGAGGPAGVGAGAAAGVGGGAPPGTGPLPIENAPVGVPPRPPAVVSN